MIVGGDGSKGLGTEGGGRAAFCRLIYDRLPSEEKLHSRLARLFVLLGLLHLLKFFALLGHIHLDYLSSTFMR